MISSLPLSSQASVPSPLMGGAASLSPTSSRNEQDVDAVAKDFESVFITQMLEHMFSGDTASSYFGSGAAGDIYKSYLLNEYGKSISNAGGIGIASTVKQELLKLQEVPHATGNISL